MMEQPISVLRGSKQLGDLTQKGAHKLGFCLREGHQMKTGFWHIDPRAFSDSRLPTKIAVSPKRLIGVPGQKPHGTVICALDANGLATLHLEMGAERVDLCEDMHNFTFIDTSIAAHGGATVSAVASGVVSVLSDQIPIWGELTAIAALAATIPRKRVRLLLEFNTGREPMVIETAEVVAILLDELCGGGGGSDAAARTDAAEGTEDVYVMF